MRKVQRTACRPWGLLSAIKSRGGFGVCVSAGISSAETVLCGTAVANLLVGACGIVAGVGFAAEIWQQDEGDGACRTEAEESCLAIIGQWGAHFSAARMCIQQSDTADAGITSVVTARSRATSLSPQFILLLESYDLMLRPGCD